MKVFKHETERHPVQQWDVDRIKHGDNDADQSGFN